MGKVAKVSAEVAEALDTLEKDEWSKRYYIIEHCKAYSGNGIRMRNIYNEELKALETVDPLVFARSVVNGYEVDKENGNIEEEVEEND